MLFLRVRFKTLFGITKFSEHTSDGSEAQEGQGFEVEVLPVFGESPTAVEPSQATFDDPALGQDGKPFCTGRTLDDHDGQIASQGSDTLTKAGALISSIRKERLELGKGLLECSQEIQPTVSILDIRRMH